MKSNIPNRVFQTHKDQETIDNDLRLQTAQSSWKQATSDYNFYDDVRQDNMMRRYFPDIYPFWKALPIPVMKADIWRYAVIYKYGGIYADADTEFSHTDISILHPPGLLVGMPETPDSDQKNDFCNWWFAAPRGSPILKEVLLGIKEALIRSGTITRDDFRFQKSDDKTIPLSDSRHPAHLIHRLTGPTALSNGIRRWAKNVGCVLPVNNKDWQMNKELGSYGLKVYSKDQIHNKVVHHLFSGCWEGGWVEQRRQFTKIAHNFGFGLRVVSASQNAIQIGDNPNHHELHATVPFPEDILKKFEDGSVRTIKSEEDCAIFKVLLSLSEERTNLDMCITRIDKKCGWSFCLILPLTEMVR